MDESKVVIFLDDEKKPPTEFDWAIYADATFAGLSPLIPLPFVDLAVEWYFRQQMIKSIGKRRQKRISSAVIKAINYKSQGCWGCLWLQFWIVIELFKELWRTVFYFLTIKDSITALSYYWHRAFLLAYSLDCGHLEDVTTALIANRAIEQTIAQESADPLRQVAQELLQGTRHLLRTMWGWFRHHDEDQNVIETKEKMAKAWQNLEGYLLNFAARYTEHYQQINREFNVERHP